MEDKDLKEIPEYSEEKEITEEEKIKKIKARRKRRPINFKKWGLIVAIVMSLGVLLINAWTSTVPTFADVTLQDVYAMNELGLIDKVLITKTADTFKIIDTAGVSYSCVNPKYDEFIYDLIQAGIPVSVQQTSLYDALMSMALTIPTTVLLLMFIYYLASTIVGGSTKMFTLLDKKQNNVKFDDIAGISEIKEEVAEITSMLSNYKKLAANGARPCKGLLLYGPPGVGKTLIAKAIANETHLPFISASGSDFVEMFVGVGAARVRNLWDLALQNAPCILFLDEIDSLGKRRGGNAGDSEKNQTLNALLQRMDGLNQGSGVFVIAATNRKEDMDEALLRPGRFDRHIYIGKPRLRKDKEELVKLYLKNKRTTEDVTVENVASLMSSMTGAQIEDALNNAVYSSFKRGNDGIIDLTDVDNGIMSIYTDGVQVSVSSLHDRKITAVHEAGHAIMNLLLGRKVAKVSVVPYSSGIGGMTVTTDDNDEDKKLRFESDFINDIKVLLAGKVAEELVFNESTQGASNDLERATELAFNLVSTFGYYDNLVSFPAIVKYNAVPSVSKDNYDKTNQVLRDTFNLVKDELSKEENILLLKKLAGRLMTEKTIVYPDLKMIKSFEEKLVMD